MLHPRPCKRALCLPGLVKEGCMAKWKRKHYLLEPGGPEEGEEFSPLGLSLLEHFASGMSAPWQQLFGEWPFWCASLQPTLSALHMYQHFVYVNQLLFFLANLCLATLFGKLRAHLFKPLPWLHPRVVPTPQTFSNLLLLATLGGQVSTSPARLSPSIANLAASPFQSHTLLMSLCV